MKEICVSKKDEGQRLDKYLLKRFPGCSRSLLFKLLRKKDIKLNRKRAEGGSIVREGDMISLFLSDVMIESISQRQGAGTDNRALARIYGAPGQARDGKGRGSAYKGSYETSFSDPGSIPQLRLSDYCDIVFEDPNVIFADKHAGILSQKSRPSDISLNEALLYHCGGIDEDGFSPTVCNRIDRNTTGLVSFAKNYASARELSDMFKSRSCGKYYLAAVLGRIEDSAREEAWFSKEERGNRAYIRRTETEGYVRIETGFEPICSIRLLDRELTLLRIRLITGKSHQIRAHLSFLGYPILGDPKYGDRAFNMRLKESYGIDGQMLHAKELCFPEEGLHQLSYLSGRSIAARTPRSFGLLFPGQI